MRRAVSVPIINDPRDATLRPDPAMTVPPLNRLLERPPLLGPGLIPETEIEAVADPFPVSHAGRLYVLAEVQGRRSGSASFKKIGVFGVSDDLARAAWLGEACPDDDGRCSFPCVVRDGERYVMVPEVFVPMQGGGPSILQMLQIWTTSAADFPFGWRKHHEGVLRGCGAPSDKVLMRDEGTWWLFCSDNAARRLLAYLSEDLRTWRPHPDNPIASRDSAPFPGGPPGAQPWRLGGAPLFADGVPALPLQHGHAGISYGGAVTLMRFLERTTATVRTRLDPAPVLAADPERAWMSRGAHHVAMLSHLGRTLVATDGFDGTRWRSTIAEAGTAPAFGPVP